ncbi:MAG: hypothetical protein KR126chlam3_00045 [Chlamydiae bacterium]|nr:hypothetical protein [Chlamydiota bacterium]
MSTAAVSNTQLQELGSAHKAHKDFFDVTCGYAGEKPYGVFKACHVLPNLFQELDILSKDNAELNAAIGAAKLAKLSRSPFDFVRNTHGLCATFVQWWKGEEREFKGKYDETLATRKVAVTDVVRDANGCIAPVWEMHEFLSKAILYSPVNMIFKGISAIALTIKFGWDAFDSLKWIESSKYSSLEGAARDEKFPKMTGHLMQLAVEVSFVALGVLTVLSVFFQFVFAPLLFAGFSASTVVFAILGYYHEHLGPGIK